MYYFEADKIRPATEKEEAQIGIAGADIFEGRLIIPVRDKDLEKAWEKAREAAAKYEAETGLKVKIIGWTNYNPANKLARMRFEAGLTQQALADAVGAHIRQIQKWESGEADIKSAAAETVMKVAEALGTTVEGLLKED